MVQLHHASHRHYDFRLELDGVLKSWAIPKGPSFDPMVKRLAVEVEDHPISYAGFEGDIPNGSYGAGHVDVFDSGTWAPEDNPRAALARGELKFSLSGRILRGSWVLVRTRLQAGKQQWLLIKHRDAHAGAGEADDFVDSMTGRPLAPRDAAPQTGHPAAGSHLSDSSPVADQKPSASGSALPGSVTERLGAGPFSPELCRSVEHPPVGERWLHEAKWDGYRMLASVVRGKARLWSRNGIEWTRRLPELAAAITALSLRSARLDGELIALKDGRDDFNALQRALADGGPVDTLTYMLFDILHADGRSLVDVPLEKRKAYLADLLERQSSPLLRYSPHQIGHGAAVFSQATAGGMEGIISKRRDSAYSGGRSGAWTKCKARASDEFIVVGFTEPQGSRRGLGALLLAKPGPRGLRYVGRVGTGIGSEQLLDLRATLEKAVATKPSADAELMAGRDRALAIWVKPTLVVEVFYQGMGSLGLLRQPAFKALRADKTPADVAAAVGLPAAAPTARAAPPSTPLRTERAMRTPKVIITHPERVVFAEIKATKQDVATYYRAVAPWLLAQIGGRPLSVVRCPDGVGAACFFQKHATNRAGAHVHAVSIKEKRGRSDHLCIDDEHGLLELVQMNVLEFHPWGARSSDPERADRVVFDFDPHPTVAWARVKAAARTLRGHLESIGLQAFLRTSGGKGLHVVVPLQPSAPWDRVREFAKAVAEAMTALEPDEFVSVAGEKNREGRIFIDWLRNGRGATSVASYSLRARPAAGVAMPLAWASLARLRSADAYTLESAVRAITRRAADPWQEMTRIRQSLPTRMALT